MSAALPTQLVFGFSGAGKTRLIRHWLGARPPTERWALLFTGLPHPVEPAGMPVQVPDAPEAHGADVAVAWLSGGCACCTGGPALATTVNRLLRQGPWDRLFIEAPAQAHPAALMDRLGAPALASRLRLLPPLLVIDPARMAPYLDETRGGHALALEQLEVARTVLLWPIVSTGIKRVDDDPKAAAERLASHLQRGDTAAAWWPPAVQSAAEGLPVPALASAHEVPGQPPLAIGQAEQGPLCWHFAPTTVFDRPRLQATLDALAAPGGALWQAGLLRARAVFRTERDWICREWRHQVGVGGPESVQRAVFEKGSQGVMAPGLATTSGTDTPAATRWRSSDWRHDSRLEVLVDGRLDPKWIGEVLSAHIVSD